MNRSYTVVLRRTMKSERTAERGVSCDSAAHQIKLQIPLTLYSSGPSAGAREVLNEETFKRMIAVERKRTERSREPFLLMLLEAGNHQVQEKNGKALDNILSVLPLSIRETDVIGWYKDRTTGGVMFTGLPGNDKNSILSVILSKVSTTLRDQLTSRPIQSS